MKLTSRIFQLVCAGLFLVPASTVVGDVFDPGEAVRLTVKLAESQHVRRTPLDDQLSKQWLRRFIDHLDPNRMYFLSTDVDEFQSYENRLDDLARSGDFEFPLLVRKVFQTRVREAVHDAEPFLATEHDGTTDEKCPVRFNEFAQGREELRERWRLRIKLELLIEKLHGRQRSEVISQLSGRHQRIVRQAETMTDERLCEIYLNSLCSLYDPHSAYLSPTVLAAYRQSVSFSIYRLGLVLSHTAGRFVITSVDPALFSRTAQKSLSGWSVVAIRRIDGPIIDVVEMPPFEFWFMIRHPSGPLGTETDIILELFNSDTLERRSLSWNRIRSS